MTATSLVLSAALAFLPVAALAASPEDELIGLWGYGTAFGPMLEGNLVVERRGKAWHAQFGGLEAAIVATGGKLAATFPDGYGKFRGTLVDGRIDGFWIRRGVTEDPRYPGGSSQPFSTPVTLRRSSPNKWIGEMHPLKDRAKLYLKIFRDDQGRLLGAFRDPYANNIGGASRFLVTREGDRIDFSQPNDAGKFEVWFKGAVSKEGLKLDWKNLDGEIEMKALARDDLHTFYARPATEPPYKYRKPALVDDGWKTARGRDVGLDEAALARAVQKIIDVDPAGRTPSLVHSILIARRGKLVLEEYFYGHDRETPHDLRSAGKTFASVMLGAAMLGGAPVSPDTKVYELFADRGPFANPDPRKASITLAHLLTHTPGLDCNDNNDDSRGNEDTLQRQKTDWTKYTLDLPMAHDPGKRYAYCSANVNLAGAALSAATKTWLPEYFDRAVARPLGFGRYHWNLTPWDEGYLGGGSWVRPRDLLKVGQAYLDGGVWRGKRIVAASWVAESTAPRIRISAQTTGLSAEEFGDAYTEADDAYAWHLGTIKAAKRSYKTYEASGNGGQVLIVVPEVQMVVVFTGGNYRQGGIWSNWKHEFIGADILSSIE